jgi:hypothetical protein
MAESPIVRRFDRDSLRVGALTSAVSMVSLLHYFQDGQILMHGDAVAHINIARRVFDSLTPGPLQLGTVWLPLPHVLMIPFLWPDAMWQSGLGGSIPSMIAYVLGVAGIFRLVRSMLEAAPFARPTARVGAVVAAFVYGANPDLIYIQTTALTEPLYMAFFVWAIVYFAEFIRRSYSALESAGGVSRALSRCAACVACAELTRYDGWFLAGAVGAIVAVVAIQSWRDRTLRHRALAFLLSIAAVPVLWLVYNALVYQNPLEFANGPYSAKAIQQQVGAPYPGFHNLAVAALYFLKSAQLSLAVGAWGRFWLVAAISAVIAIAWKFRRSSMAIPMFLLWTPLAFYTLSIAYGSVIVHVPTWWPFATFNQRYGLEMLPLFAVSAGALTAIFAALNVKHTWKVASTAVILVLISYAFVWKQQPLSWQEASRNWNIRRGIDTAVERAIAGLPPESMLLMDTGTHVGVLERLGLPLRRVVSVENHRQWKRPVDPEGLWERTLADPQKYVDYVIAFDRDSVDQKVNRSDLILLSEIHASGQPPARIFKTQRPLNQSR